MELGRFRGDRHDLSGGLLNVVRRGCFPCTVLDAQEHSCSRGIRERMRRSEAGDGPFPLRVPIILLLAAAVAITSAAAWATEEDAPGQNPPTISEPPSISGTYRERQTLTANEGEWAGPDRDYNFQWVRCGSSGSLCAPIVAAAGQQHLVVAADVGSTLRIVVTATNKNGSTVATSNATPVIAPALSTQSFTTASIPTTTTTVPTTTSTTTATTTTTTTTSSSSPYFSDDFESGYTDMCVSGVPPNSINYPVPGWTGNGVELVTPATTSGGSQGLALHLDCKSSLAHANSGEDTWYRVRLKFPADYKPVAVSSFNWIVEWHNDDHTSCVDGNCANGPYSMGMLVQSDAPEGYYPGNNSRLGFRLAGGSGLNPTYKMIQLPSNSLLRDHWYDILFHFIWSPSASIGKFEWWVDGQLIDSEHFPTIYTNSDGSYSTNGFGLYNYHPAVNWTVREDFDHVSIGPDRASVGG